MTAYLSNIMPNICNILV